MQNMEENEIKEILMNKDIKLNIIRQKRRAIIKEIVDLETNELNDEYKKFSDKFKRNTRIDNGQAVENEWDIDTYRVLIKYQEQIQDLKFVLCSMLVDLSNQETVINRVWSCFMSLDGIEFTILNQLYVEQKPYKQVEGESGLSHMPFERKRKSAFSCIGEKYNSDKTILEIFDR